MKLTRPALSGLVSLLAAVPAAAVTETWDGGGADNNISTGFNWADNTAPISDLLNADLIFAGTARLTPNYNLAFSARSVTFNNTAGAFASAGQTLTIGSGGIVNNDANIQSFSNQVTLGNAAVSFNSAAGGLTFLHFVNTGTNALSLDGTGQFFFVNFGGTGTVTKNGNGGMFYSPNPLGQTIDLIINDGNVNTVTDGTPDTFSTTGSITVNNSSILNLEEDFVLDGAPLSINAATGADLNLADGRSLTLKNSGDMTITSGLFHLSSDSPITITGAGSTLAHTGAAGSDVLALDGVTLEVSAGGAISTVPRLNLGINAATIVSVTGAGSSITAGVNTAATAFLGGGSGATELRFSNSATGSFGPLTAGFGIGLGSSTLLVESGAAVTVKGLSIGEAANAQTVAVTVAGPGSGLTVSGAGQTTVGAASTNPGTLNVLDAATFTTGTGAIAIAATGTVHLDDAALTINGPITNAGEFNFISGILNLLGPNNLTIGIGGLLGRDLTLLSDRVVSVANTTTIDTGRTLTLNGGTLRTGAMVNNGTLDFQRGIFGITGAGGLSIGAGSIGSSIALNTGSNLQVTNGTTITGGALLRVDGGSFSSGANIVNNGTIDHRDGAFACSGLLTNANGARLFVSGLFTPAGNITNIGSMTLQNGIGLIGGGGSITNTGLVTGDGAIGKSFVNSAGGQLRAEAGETLSFTGSTASNAGTIVLQGGTLGFAQPLSNGAAGQINGHGELYYPATPVPTAGSPTAGFNNSGRVNFSGGNTLVFGTSQMSAGSHLVASGGSVVTFFDIFRHSGTEVKASAASALVFFGEVRGAGAFTGTGTVYMEGGYSPGASPASVMLGPQFVFTQSNTLTMEIGGTAAGSQHDKLTFSSAASPQVTWGGTLAVEFINGYTPVAGDTFDFFDFDAARDTGTFDSLTLPPLPGGLTWNTAQLYTDGILRIATPGLTFTQWATTVLGDPAATPNGDHDTDGFSNGAEFALGLFPPQPGTVLPEGGFFNYGDGQRLRVLFTRPLDRTGVTLRVQAGSDLATWTDLAVSVNSAPFTGAGFVSENRSHPLSDPGLVEVRDILTTSTVARRQIRLLITVAP